MIKEKLVELYIASLHPYYSEQQRKWSRQDFLAGFDWALANFYDSPYPQAEIYSNGYSDVRYFSAYHDFLAGVKSVRDQQTIIQAEAQDGEKTR